MRIGEIIALAAAVFSAAFYALGQGTEILTLFSNYGLIAYMASAALIGLVAYKKLGPSKITNLTLGYAIGLLPWAVGLAIYTYAYYVSMTGLSYLSIADVFYLLSYPPWIISAVLTLRTVHRAVGRNAWLAVIATGVVLYLLVGVLVIPPSISDLSSLEAFVTALYPSLDLAFFLLVLPLLFAFRKGLLERPYAFITLGALLLALGDLAYAVLSVAGLYYDGHPMDLLLFVGCISAGYGFWRQQADLARLK